jgi:dephospho-CoA kinase
MMVIGLTGSIAMGKSETAKIFRSRGIPVFDSDAAVHHLYSANAEVLDAMKALVPAAVASGTVDRAILSKAVASRPGLLKDIESIVHPAVRRMQREFLVAQEEAGHDVAVLDIPLLFETGQESAVDRIVVVSAPAHFQRQRALQRPGMTEEKLDFILSRQLADSVKRERADYVIDTSKSIEDATQQVNAILRDIGKGQRVSS